MHMQSVCLLCVSFAFWCSAQLTLLSHWLAPVHSALDRPVACLCDLRAGQCSTLERELCHGWCTGWTPASALAGLQPLERKACPSLQAAVMRSTRAPAAAGDRSVQPPEAADGALPWLFQTRQAMSSHASAPAAHARLHAAARPPACGHIHARPHHRSAPAHTQPGQNKRVPRGAAQGDADCCKSTVCR